VGTSFSVPHVAGVAALAFSMRWDTQTLSYALYRTATKINWTNTFGIVNAEFTNYVMEVSHYKINSTQTAFTLNNTNENNNSNLYSAGSFRGNPIPSCAAGNGPNYNYISQSGISYTMMCTAPDFLCGLQIYFFCIVHHIILLVLTCILWGFLLYAVGSVT
jgi:hypothetical protein